MHHWQWIGAASGMVSGGGESFALFDGVDGYGLPWRTSAAVSSDTYVANTALNYNNAPKLTISDLWVALPAGISSVTIGAAPTGGNVNVRYYYGAGPTGVANGGSAPIALNASGYPELCGRKIIFMRGYTWDSYFQGGITFYWNIGAGQTQIPTSNIHGVAPTTQ